MEGHKDRREKDAALSRRIGVAIWIMITLALTACSGAQSAATPTPTPDPIALVTQAATNIRSAQTFRLTIAQTGPDYRIQTVQGTATFRRAEGQYVTPNVIQAQVRVVILGIPLNIDIFARGEAQWVRAVFTGNQWSDAFIFAPGFDPAALIAEETGFNAALNALLDLDYIGIETLETGVSAHHLSGVATGEGMNSLLVGIIQTRGEVPVDVYIDTETLQPIRFVLRMFEANPGGASFGGVPELETTPEVTAEPQSEPYVWILDIYDINAPAELDPPAENAETAAEATPEVTPEATEDAA
jgi:hypothetical protein